MADKKCVKGFYERKKKTEKAYRPKIVLAVGLSLQLSARKVSFHPPSLPFSMPKDALETVQCVSRAGPGPPMGQSSAGGGPDNTSFLHPGTGGGAREHYQNVSVLREVERYQNISINPTTSRTKKVSSR